MTRTSTKLFYKYYKNWIDLYKRGAVRHATLVKYELAYKHVRNLCPDLHMNQINRQSYQELLNKFAETHERETTLDFHHHIKASLVDAYEDGMIKIDPTRKAIVKGTKKRNKKKKYLNISELRALIKQLNLDNEINWDWFIFLIAKNRIEIR